MKPKLNDKRTRAGALLAVIVLAAVLVAVFHHSPASKPAQSVTVYNPTATFLHNQIQNYVGRTIGLKGNIYQSSDGNYYIVSSGEKPGAVRLDFTKSHIDPKKYANVTPDHQVGIKEGQSVATKGPYTVTGQVKAVAGQSLFLVVKTIR